MVSGKWWVGILHFPLSTSPSEGPAFELLDRLPNIVRNSAEILPKTNKKAQNIETK